MYSNKNILFYQEIKNEVPVCVHTKAPRNICKRSQKMPYTLYKFELPKKHNSSIIALCVSQIYSVLCGRLNTIPCLALLAQCQVVHRKTVLDFHQNLVYHMQRRLTRICFTMMPPLMAQYLFAVTCLFFHDKVQIFQHLPSILTKCHTKR